MAGVRANSVATLELQLIADVARLQKDMRAMERVVDQTTGGMTTSFSKAGAGAARMAADAQRSAAGLGKLGDGGKLAGHHMQNLAFQLNDVGIGLVAAAQSSNPLKMAFTVLLQQGSQISAIMSQAGVGVGGLVKQLVVAHPIMAAIAAAAAVAAAGIGLMTGEINKNSAVHVTWTDTALGTYDAIKSYLSGQLSGAFEKFGTTTGEVWEKVKSYTKSAWNVLFGVSTLGVRLIATNMSNMLPAIGSGIISAINAVIRGLNTMLSVTVMGINGLIKTVNAVLPNTLAVSTISAPKIAEIANSYAGAGAKLGGAMSKAFTDTWRRDWIGDAAGAISPFAQERARQRMAKDAKKAGSDTGKAAGKALGDAMAKEAERFLAELNKSMQDGFGQITVNMAAALKGSTNADWAEMLADARKETEAWLEPQRKLLENQAAFKEQLERLKDIAGTIDFGSVFGRGGDAIDGMKASLDRLTAAQKAYGDAQYAADQLTGKEKIDAKTKAEKAYSSAKINGAVSYLGAAKSLFREESAGAKAMEAAQKALMAVQLVKTGIDVAGGAAKMFSFLGPFAFPAVAAMMAVMAGLGFKGSSGGAGYKPQTSEQNQASIGTGTVAGDSGAQSDSLANAIKILSENSNKDLQYSNQQVGYLRDIADSIGTLVKQIGNQIGLGGSGMFSTSGLGLGQTGSSGLLGLIGGGSTTRTLYDQGIQIAYQKLGDVIANGVEAQVYNIVEQVKKSNGFLGIGGSTKTSYITSTGAVNSAIETQMELVLKNIGTSIVGFAEQLGIKAEQDIAGLISNKVLAPLQLSFKDMSADEIESALQAYFSSVADDLTSVLSGILGNSDGSTLESLQRAGEGLFETLARVTTTLSTVNTSLKSISMQSITSLYQDSAHVQSYGTSGAILGSATNLADLFGGLDEFQSSVASFYDKFLSEAEQMQPIITSVREEMARLGVAGVTTNEQFKLLVQGLDLGTEGGQSMFAALLSVAPAFAKVTEYLGSLNGELGETTKTAAQLAEIAKQRRSLEIDLMSAMGDAAGALAAQRADQLAGLDESLRGLQQQVWATLDATAAEKALADARLAQTAAAEALARQRRSLEIDLMQAIGDTAGAVAAKRADELAALDETLRGLQQQIWAAQDAAEAADALAQVQKQAAEAAAAAAEEAAALVAAALEKTRAISAERHKLEIELMDALGDAVGALAARRADELATLDESNRALQQQIWAAQDAAKAADDLAKAQADAAAVTAAAAAEVAAAAAAALEKAKAVASERRRIEIALMDALGDATGALAARRADELAALDESNRALQQQVWTALDAAAAADALAKAQADAAAAATAAAAEVAAAAAAALQKATAIAGERRKLEIELMDALGDATGALAARRADELAALDESNRALQQQVWTAIDAAKAADDLAKSQADAAAAAAAVAQAAQEAADALLVLAQKRRSLEIDLMEATGDAVGALAARRADELAALDPTLRALQEMVWAAEDAAGAVTGVSNALDLLKARADLEIRLMEAQGNASGALAARRAQELAATDATLQGLLQQIYAAEDAANAAQALADVQAAAAAAQAEAQRAAEQAAADAAAAAAEAAAAARELAERRAQLEIDLLNATGQTVEAVARQRQMELAALDGSLHALQQQVWAAQDAAAAQQAATDALNATIEAERALAEQRSDLTIRLLEAEGRATEALAMQRELELAATDDSLRAMLQAIYNAEDAAAAQEALAQAQADAAAIAEDAAARQRELAEARAQLEIDLLTATGHASEALAAQRAIELEAMDASLRGLQQQVWTAQDAAVAADALAKAQAEQAAAAAALAKDTQDMTLRLLDAQGQTSAAKAMRRAIEMEATDPSLRAMLAQVHAAEDAAVALDAYTTALGKQRDLIEAARNNLSAAYQREAGALGGTIDKFTEFSASLREFRATLTMGSGDGANAYRRAQMEWLKTSALAATGDAGALGSLAAVSQGFLEASRANAGSLTQYQRDVALVARSVDQAVGASDGAVDYAKAQLDALKLSVSGLITLDESVLSVRDAILELQEAMTAAPGDISAPGTTQGGVGSGDTQTQAVVTQTTADLRAEIAGLRADLNAALLAIKTDTGKQARILERVTADDSLRVSNESDTPLYTEVVA